MLLTAATAIGKIVYNRQNSSGTHQRGTVLRAACARSLLMVALGVAAVTLSSELLNCFGVIQPLIEGCEAGLEAGSEVCVSSH